MHIQIAHRTGGPANLLQLAQPRLGRLFQCRTRRIFAQHGLEHCLQTA